MNAHHLLHERTPAPVALRILLITTITPLLRPTSHLGLRLRLVLPRLVAARAVGMPLLVLRLLGLRRGTAQPLLLRLVAAALAHVEVALTARPPALLSPSKLAVPTRGLPVAVLSTQQHTL